jgi:hypothetical protein
MKLITERCAHGAHEQGPELVLTAGSADVQLDLLLGERERRTPGFAHACLAIKRFGVSALSRRLDRAAAEKLLKFDAEAAWLGPLAYACFSASRSGARVSVLTPNGALKSIVEFTHGATFVPAHIVGQQHGSINAAIVIDGHIESVAEIDRLLQSAASSGELCLIACRSMSADVRRTIATNVMQQRLRVSVLEFPLVDASVNTLGDACAALGVRFHDAVSTGCGWTLYGFDDVLAQHATLCDGILLVRKPSVQIAERRSTALSALASVVTPELVETVQRRLASLGSSVTVTLADDHMQAVRAKMLVMMLLILDDAAKHGIVEDQAGDVHPAGAYQAAASFLTNLKPLRAMASIAALNC